MIETKEMGKQRRQGHRATAILLCFSLIILKFFFSVDACVSYGSIHKLFHCISLYLSVTHTHTWIYFNLDSSMLLYFGISVLTRWQVFSTFWMTSLLRVLVITSWGWFLLALVIVVESYLFILFHFCSDFEGLLVYLLE